MSDKINFENMYNFIMYIKNTVEKKKCNIEKDFCLNTNYNNTNYINTNYINTNYINTNYSNTDNNYIDNNNNNNNNNYIDNNYIDTDNNYSNNDDILSVFSHILNVLERKELKNLNSHF